MFRQVLTVLKSSAGDRRESAAIKSVKALFDGLRVPVRTIHCWGRGIVQTQSHVFYQVILLVQHPESCERAGEPAEAWAALLY
jgi:hypothetical protein